MAGRRVVAALDALWEAARRFAALTLICGVLDVLLPEGEMRGYARFAMGLLIVIAMVAPLMTMINAPVTLAQEAMANAREGVAQVMAGDEGDEGARRVTAAQLARVLDAAGIREGRAVVRYGADGAVSAVRLYGEGALEDKERAALGVAVMFGLDREVVTFE